MVAFDSDLIRDLLLEPVLAVARFREALLVVRRWGDEALVLPVARFVVREPARLELVVKFRSFKPG